MFRHTAGQVQKNIVRKDPPTMSIVPLLLGPDTHPVASALTLLRVALFPVDPGRTLLGMMCGSMADALETVSSLCSFRGGSVISRIEVFNAQLNPAHISHGRAVLYSATHVYSESGFFYLTFD